MNTPSACERLTSHLRVPLLNWGVGVYRQPQGWTNYTPCFIPEMMQLIKKLYAGSETAAEVKLAIAERTRTLEIVGFSVSLAALLISLTIFCHFRSLRNNRTRIHKNLFIAMVIQVVIRLILYIDQAITRGSSGYYQSPGTRPHYNQGVDNTDMAKGSVTFKDNQINEADSVRDFLRTAGICANRHVYVDVRRGRLPAQYDHSDSVPGRRSLLRLHDDWLGSSIRHDRSLGGRHGAQVQSVKVLVGLQPDSLLLDLGGTATWCYSDVKCGLQVRIAVSKSLSVYLSLRQSSKRKKCEMRWARLCCQGSQHSPPRTAAPE
ncbi:PDF receptor [Zootermopsis nevadensis]|uniref:PDF receptor n=1 Tax=Zootermopsis nevadensis TaxID=136037 RepID=A0A067QWK4_ZOONE|nr:PDF receptor [Zootermopsis nevadensis]